jgi:hypothetical protein
VAKYLDVVKYDGARVIHDLRGDEREAGPMG